MARYNLIKEKLEISTFLCSFHDHVFKSKITKTLVFGGFLLTFLTSSVGNKMYM